MRVRSKYMISIDFRTETSLCDEEFQEFLRGDIYISGSSCKAEEIGRGSNRRGTSSTLTALCVLTIILQLLVSAGAAYLAYSKFYQAHAIYAIINYKLFDFFRFRPFQIDGRRGSTQRASR